MASNDFTCYLDANSETYEIPQDEFEQLLEQNRVLREMLEKEEGINQMLNDAILEQTVCEEEHQYEYEKLKEDRYSLYLKWSEQKQKTEELQAENEKLKAGTLLKFQEVEIEELQAEIEYLKTSLLHTENYWKSLYENLKADRDELLDQEQEEQEE